MPSKISEDPRTQKCAHPGCTCPVESGKQYCSGACETASKSGLTGNECNCNHQGCRVAA